MPSKQVWYTGIALAGTCVIGAVVVGALHLHEKVGCLTHSYLIEHTDLPEYTNCNQLLSVKHILTECTSYNQTQHQYYSFTDIKHIFNHTPSLNILNFILKINLYDQV